MGQEAAREGISKTKKGKEGRKKKICAAQSKAQKRKQMRHKKNWAPPTPCGGRESDEFNVSGELKNKNTVEGLGNLAGGPCQGRRKEKSYSQPSLAKQRNIWKKSNRRDVESSHIDGWGQGKRRTLAIKKEKVEVPGYLRPSRTKIY